MTVASAQEKTRFAGKSHHGHRRSQSAATLVSFMVSPRSQSSGMEIRSMISPLKQSLMTTRPSESTYYERNGPMSLEGHLELFRQYDGPKRQLTTLTGFLEHRTGGECDLENVRRAGLGGDRQLP